MAIIISSKKLAALIVAALLAGYVLGRSSTTTTTQTSEAIKGGRGSGGAFVLLVNMKFTSLSHRDTFIKLIEPVCKDVLVNEGPLSSAPSILVSDGRSSTETTLSYQVAISDQDPLKVLVMERYSDKDHGYLEVHKSGEEFLQFREKLKGMQERGDVAIEGESYLETDLGYV